MTNRRLLRPAVFVPGSLLVDRDAEGTSSPVVSRKASMLFAGLGRIGYFCIAMLPAPAGSAGQRVRLARMHQRLLGELRRYGGLLVDASELSHPPDQPPSGKQWSRKVVEAATRHRLDLTRSWYLCVDETDVDAARIVGLTSLFIGVSKCRVQPTYAVDGLASAQRVIEFSRTRAVEYGG